MPATQTRPLRTREDAPDEVKARGGVALSLWMTGAGETDCLIVAGLSRNAERYRDALEDLLDWAEHIEGEGRLRRTEALAQAREALDD